MNEGPIDVSAGAVLRVPMLAMTCAVVFVACALQYTPALAADARGTAPTADASVSGEAPQWTSGGVGEEARAEMLAVASTYNVHVMFSRTDGAYLAGVPFTVADNAGRIIHSGVSDGPLLYIKLKPGSYQLSAEFDGVDGAKQTRRFRLGTAGSSVKLSFVARSE